ncbi:MAG: hypothetical protein ABSC95_17850 [Acetobacteraceae bacterium]
MRNDGGRPEGLDVKLRRRTPALVARDADLVDWFCLGDADAARNQGHNVVTLHDGWYADDTGGGVTIFGPYWEIRDTPFTVREAAPDLPSTPRHQDQTTEIVNVRKAIFGA